MKIDIHTHILPENWPNLSQKYGYRGGWLEIRHESKTSAKLYKDNGDFFREIESNCWDLSKRLEEMNQNKVNVQLLSTVPVMFNYWAKAEDTLDLCRFLNEDIAGSVAKHPNRFAGLGSIPLQNPELCVEELKRIKSTEGLYGIQIGTHFNNLDFDATFFDPIFKTCSELDLPIFVHPWDMTINERTKKFWLPWLVGMPSETSTSIISLLMGGVLLKYPQLKICFAHGGGAYPFTQGRINHGYDVRPDLCATKCDKRPREFHSSIYVDSLVHDDNSLDLLTKVFDINKICLGSDYPFPLGELKPGCLIESCNLLDNRHKQLLLWENAKNLFNLPDHYLM